MTEQTSSLVGGGY